MAPHLSIANGQPRFLDGATLLHDLVGEGTRSNAIAIDHLSQDGSRRSLSYEDLHTRSHQLALRLEMLRQRQSLHPVSQFIVPLYLPQGPELYISQLAVLKAGGAFCPFALDAPHERVRFMLKDIEASVLLTTSALASDLPDVGDITVLAVDDEGLDTQDSEELPDVQAFQPAYVLYTSGSTGQPKGVIVSHSAVTQALLAHQRHIPDFSRFLQFASPTFDVSVFEIFFPLFRGCTIVSCDRTSLLGDLPGIINKMDIDAAELTPSVANTLLGAREGVPQLGVLLTIGEMLKQSVVQEFAGDDHTPGILHGMYGPTEATIHCTLQPAFQRSMSVRNIGMPLDTVSAFVIRQLTGNTAPKDPIEIVPIGEEGELAIGGHQLATGYLNRNEQTAAAFVRHPQHGMLYRTGDAARMLKDGSLECLGRITSGQVKLRGQVSKLHMTHNAWTND